jgi:hypothetical protein
LRDSHRRRGLEVRSSRSLPVSRDTCWNMVLAQNAHPFDDQPIRINPPQGLFALTRSASGGCDFSASTGRRRRRRHNPRHRGRDGRDDCAGVPDSLKELSVLAQWRLRLHPVRTVQDRVQEQLMDTGPGMLAKTTFDSLSKSIYTLSDEGKDQFLYAHWP